jgi:hypothetical protein
MWRVADLASFHPHRRVLEREGTSLVYMALKTGFFICQGLGHQCRPRGESPGWRERSVWIVTVYTRHESFIHAMLKRQREIASDIGMAPVTCLRRALGQQKLRRRRLMDRVTLGTGDPVHCVRGGTNVGAAETLRMTTQASI